jgi:hypothetical protein
MGLNWNTRGFLSFRNLSSRNINLSLEINVLMLKSSDLVPYVLRYLSLTFLNFS